MRVCTHINHSAEPESEPETETETETAQEQEPRPKPEPAPEANVTGEPIYINMLYNPFFVKHIQQ